MTKRFLVRATLLSLGIVAVSGLVASSERGGERPRRPIVRPASVSLLVPAARQKPARRVRPQVVARDAARFPFSPTHRKRAANANGAAVPFFLDNPAQGSPGFPAAPDAPAVRRAWVKRFREIQGNIDLARDMVVTADGSIYVTGMSIDDATSSDVITIKYSADGTAQWRRRYHYEPGSLESGNGVAVDRFGNVYVAGTLNYYLEFHQYLLLKYFPDGRLAWARRIPSGDLDGYGNSMALDVVVDPFDNVYFTGRAGAPRAADSGYDFMTLKLDPDGNEIWRHRYAGVSAGGWGDEPAKMALDPFGNLIIGGEGPGSAGDPDWVVVKISPEGALLWRRYQRGAVGGRDEVHDLVVDAEGNVIVTGKRVRPRGDSDILTIKYSPLGSSRWHAPFDGPFHDADEARGVAVDRDGNVFVTGYTWGGEFADGGTTYDAVTLKLDANGHREWSHVVSSPNRWFDWGAAAVAAGDGGVYIGGASQGVPGEHDDFMVLRYSATGEVLWRALYDGTGDNTDSVSFLGRDGEGGLYATGRSSGRLGTDFATVKYVEY